MVSCFSQRSSMHDITNVRLEDQQYFKWQIKKTEDGINKNKVERSSKVSTSSLTSLSSLAIFEWFFQVVLCYK